MSEESAPAPTPGRGPRAALITLLVLVGVVVVIALVTVLLRGGPTALDETSPEGVAQRYTQALIDGDVEAAVELLAPGDDDCGYFMPDGTEYRVTLAGTTVDGDTARVRVVVTYSYSGGLFGGGESQSEEVFRLTRTDGDWLIVSAPWPFVECMRSAQ
ncbi:hypothetical protein ACFC3F_01295 [Microbacterium sp. NPDC055910]|uniref:hypothetical protein n=1 Tax=Microbacterium sp. NPDC055910 TaxID=3345659 RepID=UPI0035DD1D6F